MRRPVHVVSTLYREYKSINVVETYKQQDLGGGAPISIPTNIYVDKLVTPMRVLACITVCDETGENLDFEIDYPTRKDGTMVGLHVFTFTADKRDWRLRLGEYRDDQHEEERQRDERGRFIGIDPDDIEE